MDDQPTLGLAGAASIHTQGLESEEEPVPTTIPMSSTDLIADKHSESSSDDDEDDLDDDDDDRLPMPTKLIPAADQPQSRSQGEGDKEEPARGVRDISKAIETLPETLRGPLKEILGAEDGNEVINEEGLPVIDIREEVKSGQGQRVKVEVSTDEGEGDTSGKEEGAGGVKKEEDDYWSAAAVARRKKLRERLFNSDDSDEDVNRSRSEKPSKAAVSQPVVEDKPTKPGFMLAARELKHSTPEDRATIDLVEKIPDIKERASRLDKGKGKAVSDSSPSPGDEQNESAPVPQRRKSVTFAAQAKVRTYEKGEAIPVMNKPVDEEGVTKEPAHIEPKPSTTAKAGNDKLFSGFKKGFLNGSQKTSSALPTKVVASPKVSLSKSNTRIEMVEDVSAPTVSIKTAQVASQRKMASAPSSTSSAPFRSEIVMDPDFALPADLQAQLDQMTGEPPLPLPDTLQPLAPSHDDANGKQSGKGKSLFAMRNKALANGLIPGRNTSSTSAPPSEGEMTDGNGTVGTGASRFDRAGDPIKFKVVEKPPRPIVEKRAMPEVAEMKPLKVAPKRKEAIGGIVERSAPSIPRNVDAGEAIPLPSPESITGQKVQTTQLQEQLDQANGNGHEDAPEAPVDDESAEEDDDLDSNKSYEYSDTESVNFDMDRGLLAREAAMAYHQKRSALGRKALGGWTGIVDEDGKTGFYSDEVDEAQIKSEAVSFGEKLLPRANLRNFDVSKEDEDDDDIPSVNLPTIIPGADNLPSMIRVGKLENGNLILQAEEESEDEFADAPEGLKRETEEQKAWRAEFREKMAAKNKKKEIVARLGKGEVEEMIREDEARETQAKASRVIKDYDNVAPKVREEAAPQQNPVEEVVTERKSKSPLVGAIKEKGSIMESKAEDEPVADKPKKVSRFKAARMAGNSNI
jgi:hypothetical protein